MKIPKHLRAIIKYCPHGEMDGYFVTEDILTRFAKIMGNKYIDQVIPIKESQPVGKKCPSCHGIPDDVELKDAAYWEIETGKHGWCCATCGVVFQWG